MHPRPRPLLAVALAATLVPAAIGCSGQGDQSSLVRATLARFETATARHDYTALCDRILSRRLVERLTQAGLPCPVALRVGLGGVRQPKLTVQRVLFEGPKGRPTDALATVRSVAAGQPESIDTLRLVRERGGWRIANLASGPQPHGPVLGPAPPPKPKPKPPDRRQLGRR
ncbi:MAG TPA: hypothetical protein VHE14_09300 [Solirubrobacteraceae bacterium]|nr:hypothetical protein [Solirubrobacteraceae bacterium]